MRPRVAVTFLPSGSSGWVEPGTTVLDAAKAAGITIVAACGGRGRCGTCGVRVEDGTLAPPDDLEAAILARAVEGVRLACRARVVDHVVVRPVVNAATGGPAAAGRGAAAEVVVGVDLGTTNVAALAVEANGGREAGRATTANRQQSWGSDVLSRVSAAVAGSLVDLQQAAVASVSEVVLAAAGGAKIDRIVVAGNSVMAALLAGADVTAIGAAPYPAPNVPRVLPGGCLTGAGETPPCLLVPPVASFVGGDVLAGAVHTGMLYADAPTLLVDMGTNAEIILAAESHIWATSAPAGPAFEGFGIECGGPATEGAITAVRIRPDGFVAVETIGDVAPTWFSGAGILSAIAEFVRHEAIAPDGALQRGGGLSDAIYTREDGVARIAVHRAEGATISVSQLDVRGVQLAKGAVRAGVEAVLQAAGATADELADVYVAGAFGAALATRDLIDLGVLPVSAATAVRFVGNASLFGATAMALDPAMIEDAAARTAGVHHVELAADPEFTSRLMRAVALEPYDL